MRSACSGVGDAGGHRVEAGRAPGSARTRRSTAGWRRRRARRPTGARGPGRPARSPRVVSSSASASRPSSRAIAREVLGFPHQQAVQPDVLHVERVRRRVERRLVVDGRVVVGGLVHRGELRVHEVPVADRRRPVLEQPVAVAVAGLEPPVERAAQDRVRALEQVAVGVAPVRLPDGVAAERRVRAVDPVGQAAAQAGQVPVLGGAGERRPRRSSGRPPGRPATAARIAWKNASDCHTNQPPNFSAAHARVATVYGRSFTASHTVFQATTSRTAARLGASEASAAADDPASACRLRQRVPRRGLRALGVGRDRGGERDRRRHGVEPQHRPPARLRGGRPEVVAARLELAPGLGAVLVQVRRRPAGSRSGRQRRRPCPARPAATGGSTYAASPSGTSEPHRPVAERRLEAGLQQEPEPQAPLGRSPGPRRRRRPRRRRTRRIGRAAASRRASARLRRTSRPARAGRGGTSPGRSGSR